LYTAGLILFCGLLCMSAFAAVIASTDDARLLAGLRGLGLPVVFVSVIALVLRYAQVLGPELARLRLARAARTIGAGGPGRLRSGANLLGVLFVRSFDRADRVGQAMAARGWTGQPRVLRPTPIRQTRWFEAAGFVFLAVAIRFGGAAFHG
jgi:cobalt/nickel transport system permease protein